MKRYQGKKNLPSTCPASPVVQRRAGLKMKNKWQITFPFWAHRLPVSWLILSSGKKTTANRVAAPKNLPASAYHLNLAASKVSTKLRQSSFGRSGHGCGRADFNNIANGNILLRSRANWAKKHLRSKKLPGGPHKNGFRPCQVLILPRAASPIEQSAGVRNWPGCPNHQAGVAFSLSKIGGVYPVGLGFRLRYALETSAFIGTFALP